MERKVSVNGIAYFFWRRRMRHGSQVISGISGRALSPHESGKVRLAQRLRVETTVTLKWIAERLRIGTRDHPTHLLYWRGRKKPLKRKGVGQWYCHISSGGAGCG